MAALRIARSRCRGKSAHGDDRSSNISLFYSCCCVFVLCFFLSIAFLCYFFVEERWLDVLISMKSSRNIRGASNPEAPQLDASRAARHC